MSRAFTLIELILVILIVSILAVAAVSRMGDMGGFKQDAALNKLKSDLKYAKEFAVNNNCRTRIVFYEAPSNYYTITTDLPGGIVDPATNISPFTVQFNSGIYKDVQIERARFPNKNWNAIEFDSIGRPYRYRPSNGRSILLTADRNNPIRLTGPVYIIITPETGRIE